jgi:hypothetical protein
MYIRVPRITISKQTYPNTVRLFVHPNGYTQDKVCYLVALKTGDEVTLDNDSTSIADWERASRITRDPLFRSDGVVTVEARFSSIALQ